MKREESSDEDEDMGGTKSFDFKGRTSTPGNTSWKADSVAGYSKASGSRAGGGGQVNIT